jgi:hypothetical protein
VLRMVVRPQTRWIFRRAVGSSARIGVCLVVIGGPTVRLADLVGTERDGAGSVGLTAATALTVRLCGWAAAPGRPPPAVRPRHRATGELRNPNCAGQEGQSGYSPLSVWRVHMPPRQRASSGVAVASTHATERCC